MISIAVISQKGGVGKTTLMTAFAAYAAGAGQRAWVIDMDPLNASAFRWGEERANHHPEAPLVHVEMAHNALTLSRALEAARRDRAGAILIDTPQGTGDVHFTAIAGAHLVLVPCLPSFFDANAILLTLERAAKEGKPVYVVFTDVEPGDKAGDVDSTKAGLIAAAKEMGLPPPMFCPHQLHHNAEHRHAASAGLGATETAPSKVAGRDMKALAKWAFEIGEKAAKSAAAATPDSTLQERIRARRAAR